MPHNITKRRKRGGYALPWTEAEVRQLVTMYASGQSLFDIAHAMKRNYDAVKSGLARIRRLKLADLPKRTGYRKNRSSNVPNYSAFDREFSGPVPLKKLIEFHMTWRKRHARQSV